MVRTTAGLPRSEAERCCLTPFGMHKPLSSEGGRALSHRINAADAGLAMRQRARSVVNTVWVAGVGSGGRRQVWVKLLLRFVDRTVAKCESQRAIALIPELSSWERDNAVA